MATRPSHSSGPHALWWTTQKRTWTLAQEGRDSEATTVDRISKFSTSLRGPQLHHHRHPTATAATSISSSNLGLLHSSFSASVAQPHPPWAVVVLAMATTECRSSRRRQPPVRDNNNDRL